MMKCLILCRILPALLYMTVVFDITACGEQNQLPKTEESCIQSINEISAFSVQAGAISTVSSPEMRIPALP